MTAPPEKLELHELTKRFATPEGDEMTVLDHVSLSVAAGETLAILGPSGSGKSTLLNILGTLDRPTSGKVTLGDTDLSTLTGRDLASFRAQRVGFVFQEHHLLPQLTALENVLLPGLALGPTRSADLEDVAHELLSRVRLTERMDAYPAQMSGGERQRVALARALVNGAGLLLCDEPTGNLDRQTGSAVVSLLLEIAQQRGVTVLMVTHNLAQAARFGRRLQLLDGRLSPVEAEEVEGGIE